jgi:hypothetical protein
MQAAQNGLLLHVMSTHVESHVVAPSNAAPSGVAGDGAVFESQLPAQGPEASGARAPLTTAHHDFEGNKAGAPRKKAPKTNIIAALLNGALWSKSTQEGKPVLVQILAWSEYEASTQEVGGWAMIQAEKQKNDADCLWKVLWSAKERLESKDSNLQLDCLQIGGLWCAWRAGNP